MAMRKIVHPHLLVLLNKFKIRCWSFAFTVSSSYIAHVYIPSSSEVCVSSAVLSLYLPSSIFYCVRTFFFLLASFHFHCPRNSQIEKTGGKNYLCCVPVHIQWLYATDLHQLRKIKIKFNSALCIFYAVNIKTYL